MKSLMIKNPRYVKSAIHSKDYPILKNAQGREIPEIAVAGRSNVGKSSLLNDLFQSKGLVKTSSTPGKTQMLNFFAIDESLVFVDLPGYGFAKVPLKVREKWGPMVQNYLTHRQALKIVLCLFDIRRLPNEEDKQMMEWAVYADKSIILVLTKVDKVSGNEKRANTQKILRSFPFENLQYVHYSATKNQGRKELIFMLQEALKEEDYDGSN